jgi:transposase
MAFTRMSSDPRTRAYVERRTLEGRSKPEYMRVLRRSRVR